VPSAPDSAFDAASVSILLSKVSALETMVREMREENRHFKAAFCALADALKSENKPASPFTPATMRAIRGGWSDDR
jgi:hypothetical protein